MNGIIKGKKQHALHLQNSKQLLVLNSKHDYEYIIPETDCTFKQNLYMYVQN